MSEGAELLALIRQAQRGDERAFESLLERYNPLILSQVTQLGDAADREDLQQEAVLGFYAALCHFDAEQDKVRFGLYAKACIKNRLLSYLRRTRKHGDVLPVDEEDTEAVTIESSDDPARRLIEEESYMALCKQVFSTLSPYENRVWWMFLSGLTAREIAEREGREEKSVQNAVYRIRNKLRRTVGGG